MSRHLTGKLAGVGLLALATTAAALTAPATAGTAHAERVPRAADRPSQRGWIARQVAQAPLDAVANAVFKQGTHAFSDSYSGLVVSSRPYRVLVYVTSLPRGRQLLAAAKKADPSIDVRLAVLEWAPYTFRSLEAAARRLMTQPGVYAVGPTPSGSGLEVSAGPRFRVTNQVANAARGIPIAVRPGSPGRLLTWRWNDTPPFIGGDLIIHDNGGGTFTACTGGIAAEEGSRDYLLTADHCFLDNQAIYGEGDPVGDLGGTQGNKFGTITATDPYTDTEAINTGKNNGAGTNSDEADQPQGKWYRVTSDSYASTGDGVCQDGDATYYDYDGQYPFPPAVPCDMTVAATGVYVYETIHGTRYELQGDVARCNPYCAQPGDSGALVFEVRSGTRTAVGQVLSFQSYDGRTDLFWVPAPVDLADIGMVLNPHT